jgi:hypothetical protein
VYFAKIFLGDALSEKDRDRIRMKALSLACPVDAPTKAQFSPFPLWELLSKFLGYDTRFRSEMALFLLNVVRRIFFRKGLTWFTKYSSFS